MAESLDGADGAGGCRVSVYYNEIDPYAAQWLRNLISAGHLPAGDVDERSIEDVTPNDLRGYTQCHFFAGIGGWAYALALAGWPASRPVWTGSCPCQPFSAAGKGAGFADQRHLWPAFCHLIRECRPPIVFGEQVASKDADPWIDLVQDDLEAVGYAVGAVPFPAASVGAPHIRDRLYWVGLADPHDARLEGRSAVRQRADQCAVGAGGVVGNMANTVSAGRSEGWPIAGVRQATGGCEFSGLANTSDSTGQRGESRATERGLSQGLGQDATLRPSPTNGFWRNADWILCRDGKWRPVEPGTFPLAHGLPARVGRLRGYGNAIVPQQAAEFIAAYMEVAGFSAMPEAA